MIMSYHTLRLFRQELNIDISVSEINQIYRT